MFKIYHDGLVLTVYGNRVNYDGHLEFLVFYDNTWDWIKAEGWMPYNGGEAA